MKKANELKQELNNLRNEVSDLEDNKNRLVKKSLISIKIKKI